MTERKYPHPGFNVSLIEFKIWEIRNQLEINIELMKQTCPMTLELFGYPIEMMTNHVFDRLDELEKMVAR